MDITELTNLVEPLMAEQNGYITFLECYEIARLLPQIDFLPTTAIPYLEQLLYHPRLTLGGYKILQEALEKAYQKLLAEWRLGQTAITYNDNNATLRLLKNSQLALLLTEEADGSQNWQEPTIIGPLSLTFSKHFAAESSRHQGYFRTEFLAGNCGVAQITLSYLGLGLARKAQKPFVLKVFIEETLIPRLELDLGGLK